MSSANASSKYIYFFGQGQADGSSDQKHLIGGKGASLAEMTRAQLNVPPGFTISAECCQLYYQAQQQWPAGLEEEVRANLGRLEHLAGRPFGQGDDPLLVAVRSGAAQSMPGMMDTILNVGLNPACVRAQAQRTGNQRGAWEAYYHFLLMFARTVGNLLENTLGAALTEALQSGGKTSEAELTAGELEALCQRLLAVYQQHTGRPLSTEPWTMLVEAINAVFASWNCDRAVTYRRYHHIEGLLGTAVNVQMMCPSEVSGVMFTGNPVDPKLPQIIIESSFGLGEAIVLGKVTPDRFVLDKKSLQIQQRSISQKERIVAAFTDRGHDHLGKRDAASLTDGQVADLGQLGLRVEQYFQVPCDIEWALSRGQFFLLQARPIKAFQARADTTESAELEEVRRQEIAALQARAEPGGTVWARFNLSEVLPAPTPMTWAIVRRFMSGKGGFGRMYRDLGYDPDSALDEEGIFDLVCGRPYCNLSREPRMYHRTLPFEHPFGLLKEQPHRALYPQAILNPARAGWKFWLLFPVIAFKLVRSGLRLKKMSLTFAQRFREEIVTAFVREVEAENAVDLTQLDTAALLTRLEYWIKRTLHDFARDSLKPTALAGIALGNLEKALTRSLSAIGHRPSAIGQTQGADSRQPTADSRQPTAEQQAKALIGELVMGIRPDPATDLPGAIRDLAAGRLDRQTFLQCFGHRASHEMELAHPRWAEDPAAVDLLLQETAQAQTREQESDSGHDAARQTRTWEQVAAEARLSPPLKAALEKELQILQTYLGLRESAKHYLLQGYALIRRILVELDRRLGLNGDIFYLTPDDLSRLQIADCNIQNEKTSPSGSSNFQPESANLQSAIGNRQSELSALIAERKRRRRLTLSLPVPQVLFSDDLEAIGRQVEAAQTEDVLMGTPLSAGVTEGLALVLEEPEIATVPAEPYILVCPTTDPAWVPLFVHARGLVMETGGILSHGAIVAREFGLPAVAGLPEIHRRLRTGQRLRIDGSSGSVQVLPE